MMLPNCSAPTQTGTACAGVLGGGLGAWVGRCIRAGGNDLSMSQVQQIVDSLLPDVPVQRR